MFLVVNLCISIFACVFLCASVIIITQEKIIKQDDIGYLNGRAMETGRHFIERLSLQAEYSPTQIQIH